MNLVDSRSLAGTLNRIRLGRLRGNEFTKREREETAAWIAGRLSVPGSYSGLPAPTPADYRAPLHLFTGERVGSHAGTGCKLGFEGAWALNVLAPTSARAVEAAETCRRRVVELFSLARNRGRGMYCCYSCSVAGWPALCVSGRGKAARLLGAGLALLHEDRDGRGRWSSFPFWYTILALSEIQSPVAMAELRYAAPVLERSLATRGRHDAVSLRRRLLARTVLEGIVHGVA